jgi:hypothetical protein
MRAAFIRCGAVVVAVVVSVSCVIPLMINDDPWWGRSAATFRRVVPLEPGGSLLLENETGDVEIRGWERSEVEISAEEGWGRLSRPGFGLGSWGRASSPDIGVDKIENLVKIAVRTPGRVDIGRPIDFEINVPRSITIQNIGLKAGNLALADLFGKVKADVEDGDVRISNFSGSVDLLAGRGRVEVELLDLRAEDEVLLTVKEGDLTVYLQPDASVRIEASASNGEITSEFDLGTVPPAKKAAGAIGKAGGASLSLTAFRGDIHLKKTR